MKAGEVVEVEEAGEVVEVEEAGEVVLTKKLNKGLLNKETKEAESRKERDEHCREFNGFSFQFLLNYSSFIPQSSRRCVRTSQGSKLKSSGERFILNYKLRTDHN